MKTLMLKAVTSIHLVILFVCFSIRSYAGHDKNADKENTIIIAGLQDSVSEGTVELKLYPWLFERRNDLDAIIYSTKTVNGRYKFVIQAPKKLCYVSLFFSGRIDKYTPVYQYLISAGDSIFIRSNHSDFVFSGEGATSFQCQLKVDLMNSQPLTNKEIQDLQPYVSTYWFNQAVKRKTDSFYNKKLKVIDSYRPRLPKRIYAQLVADCVGQKLLNLFNGYEGILSLVKDSVNLATTRRFYVDSFLNRNFNVFPFELMISSKNYADALAAKVVLDLKLKLNTAGALIETPSLKLCCDYISKNFTGELREKLIAICFIRFFHGKDQDMETMDVYLPTIHRQYYRNIMTELSTAMMVGKPAFRFQLKDSLNRTYSLKNFKDKAIVLTFWFRGCASCYHLEQYMKEIRKYFVNRKDLVFVSVNVDEERNKWIAGLNDKRHGTNDQINLYTNGKGVNDPLLKYYQYQSMPQILIIDKHHNVIATHPIPPVDTELQKDFIALLEKALITPGG